MSIFDKHRATVWPYRWAGTLHVRTIAGGIPSDPKVAEGFIRTKLVDDRDDLIRDRVAQLMLDRGITAEAAAEAAAELKHLTGFLRDEHGLYIRDYHLKAALKEAVSVCVNAGTMKAKGWGNTNKGALSWAVEHIHVLEERLYLGVTEPSGVAQGFVSTWRGTGIRLTEYVEDAKVGFTVMTDHDFSEKEWAAIWLTGEQMGIGAHRPQGFGKYEVTSWERVN